MCLLWSVCVRVRVWRMRIVYIPMPREHTLACLTHTHTHTCGPVNCAKCTRTHTEIHTHTASQTHSDTRKPELQLLHCGRYTSSRVCARARSIRRFSAGVCARVRAHSGILYIHTNTFAHAHKHISICSSASHPVAAAAAAASGPTAATRRRKQRTHSHNRRLSAPAQSRGIGFLSRNARRASALPSCTHIFTSQKTRRPPPPPHTKRHTCSIDASHTTTNNTYQCVRRERKAMASAQSVCVCGVFFH